jgi:uncharacterized BrkB/YihY/UPF0761 family membrane protein
MKIEQYTFLRKRKELAKVWNIVGVLALLFIAGIMIWITLKSPLLIIPFQAITKVEQGILQQSTLEMMALFLPIIMLMFFIVMMTIVFIMFKVFANEKKYLNIIDELVEVYS